MLPFLASAGLLAGGLRHPWAGTAACALVWGLAWRTDRLAQRRLVAGKGAGLWASFLVWLGLSVLASDQPWKGVYPLSVWLAVSAFFFMARGLWEEPERLLWLWTLCGASLVLMAGSVLIQRVSYPWTGFMPPYYNYNAFVMVAVIGAGIGALGSGLSGRQRWGLMVVMALAVLWLLAARSRGGLFAAAAAAAIWLYRKERTRILFVGVLAAVTIAALIPQAGWERPLKLDMAYAFRRPQIWAAAVKMATEHPLLGAGLGNFEQGFVRHAFPARLATNYGFFSDRAHSEPLHLLAETGWVGLALFLAGLAVFLRGAASPAASSPRPLRDAGLGAFTAMSAHLLVDNMLHLPALALLYFSALAVASGRDALPEGDARPAAQERPSLWRPACAAGLALALTAWIPARLGEILKARTWSDPDSGRRIAAARAAVSLAPANDHLRSVLARAYMRASPPRPEAALREFKAASTLNPFNALHHAMAAEVHLRSGRPGPALAPLGEAVRLEPNFHNARLLLAEVLYRMGRTAPAREELSRLDERVESAKAFELHGGYDEIVVSLDERRRAALAEALTVRSPRGTPRR
ncbi:MAG: O-antigen ligase family protein [Elusimicrobia bacterium]|nr:O-antigen ligase family protein [Elusimicrobiota bacterium]